MPVPTPVEVLYCCPSFAHAAFVRRLRDCAARFRVDLHALTAPALAQRSRTAAFVSTTQPIVVVVRGDDVIAQTIGAVSSHELDALLAHALV